MNEIMDIFISQQIKLSKTKINFKDDMVSSPKKNFSFKEINNKLLTCGNVSYSSDSQYLAKELIDRFEKNRNLLSSVLLLNDSYNLSFN